MSSKQRLYWSVAKPLRWLGLTIDEWVLLFIGLIHGIFMVNGDDSKLGLLFIISGGILCIKFLFIIPSWHFYCWLSIQLWYII